MPIIAVPVSKAKESKFTLPEPDIQFFAATEEELAQTIKVPAGAVAAVVIFPNLETDTQKRSKQTLYFARTNAPVDVEVMAENPENGEIVPALLFIDTNGRQNLQFRCALSAPYLEEKEQKEGTSEAENSGDPEDEEV